MVCYFIKWRDATCPIHKCKIKTFYQSALSSFCCYYFVLGDFLKSDKWVFHSARSSVIPIFWSWSISRRIVWGPSIGDPPLDKTVNGCDERREQDEGPQSAGERQGGAWEAGAATQQAPSCFPGPHAQLRCGGPSAQLSSRESTPKREKARHGSGLPAAATGQCGSAFQGWRWLAGLRWHSTGGTGGRGAEGEEEVERPIPARLEDHYCMLGNGCGMRNCPVLAMLSASKWDKGAGRTGSHLLVEASTCDNDQVEESSRE